MDWIQGQKFIQIADFTYSPAVKVKDDYDSLPNTFDLSLLKELNIVYTHTMYVKQLFHTIAALSQRFVIITHNSDVNIHNAFKPPENVVKWHSQNVDVIDDRIESIPIGLENDRWFKKVNKKEKMLSKLKEQRKIKNLVYMNHNIKTNLNERLHPYQLLRDKSWVTADMRVNGEDFDNYIDNIYNHKYVICPRGNGMDTHRFWETLYMGAIPIVKKDINNWFYCDIPILYVNDWDEVTLDTLDDMYIMLSNGEWDTKKLTFTYWKNKILNQMDNE